MWQVYVYVNASDGYETCEQACEFEVFATELEAEDRADELSDNNSWAFGDFYFVQEIDI